MIYQLSLDLSPKNDGVLLLESTLINSTQYYFLNKTDNFWNLNKTGRINYGDTIDKGARFVATMGSLEAFPSVMDKIAFISFALITKGLDKGDGKKVPRPDLLQSLNNAKAYITKDIKRVPSLGLYFPTGSVVRVDSIRKGTKLYEIHGTNAKNTKTGFYDVFDKENDKDLDKLGKGDD